MRRYIYYLLASIRKFLQGWSNFTRSTLFFSLFYGFTSIPKTGFFFKPDVNFHRAPFVESRARSFPSLKKAVKFTGKSITTRKELKSRCLLVTFVNHGGFQPSESKGFVSVIGINQVVSVRGFTGFFT